MNDDSDEIPEDDLPEEKPEEVPEVTEVPDSKTFANHLADSFLNEGGMSVEINDGEELVDVIMSIPELHNEFTIWLCELARECSFEDTKSPRDTMLN